MLPKKIQLTPQGPGDFCSVRDDPGSPLGAASVFVVLLLPLLLGPVPVALLLISVRWNKVSPPTLLVKRSKDFQRTRHVLQRCKISGVVADLPRAAAQENNCSFSVFFSFVVISATSGVIDQCTVQTEADKSRPQRWPLQYGQPPAVVPACLVLHTINRGVPAITSQSKREIDLWVCPNRKIN